MTLKAIIVDDEESARDVLENLLVRFCPEVTIVGKYNGLKAAVDGSGLVNPDLAFLDIEMPNYAGYEIVNFFDEVPFEIIFVTAYDKYALRAFEVAAIDYLLKPVDIERLKDAVGKVAKQIDLKGNMERLSLLKKTITTKEISSIMITDKGYQYAVPLDQIVALEAEESYTTVHTIDKKYTVSKNLKHFEIIFSGNLNFIRVHKSWMISKRHMLNYSKSDLSINLAGGLVAKLSKYKKQEFEAALLSG